MKAFLFILISLYIVPESTPFFKKGVVLVQYNAEFNKSNNVNLSNISDAKIIDAWIDEDAEYMVFGNVKSVPTIVLYNDREEVARWEADLSMTLKGKGEDIQKEIDKLTGINKF